MSKNGCFWRWAPLLFAVSVISSEVIAAPPGINERLEFSGTYSQAVELNEGEVVEISAGVESPSQLPPNGRLAIQWTGPAADDGFRKVLHALDPDVYIVYLAPQAGRYTLSLRAVEDEEPPATSPRWRETGVLA